MVSPWPLKPRPPLVPPPQPLTMHSSLCLALWNAPAHLSPDLERQSRVLELLLQVKEEGGEGAKGQMIWTKQVLVYNNCIDQCNPEPYVNERLPLHQRGTRGEQAQGDGSSLRLGVR